MTSTMRRAVRTGRVIREVLLTVLALGGVACIVLVILAFTGGYSLIMFKTGSMAPVIPAGSVALVQQVSAGEVAVGDIVTVDRQDALPITHRITSITDGPSAELRTITMRGDANEVDDPAPYTVSDVRIVRGSVPHLANVIVWFGNPWVLGGITIGAAVLVTWAFWPREPRAVPPEKVETEDKPTTRKERRAAGIVVVGLIIASSTTIWAPQPAQASSDILTLSSDLASGTTYALDAVDPLNWHVTVNAASAPDDGNLTVDLTANGSPDLALNTEVRSCEIDWTATGCDRGERVLQDNGPLPLDGTWASLLNQPTPASAHLRISLTATSDADTASASATVTVRATAGQEVADDTINGGDDLPPTGGQSWLILAAPAAVLVGLGVALLVAAKRRRK
ncbi:MAG: signal peptidase I [Microbacterium sp.]|uniref:signal peptidase I n=1 Tax=Microbacterium sp. TaxID=51671 RepID=UPI003F9DC072